VRTSNSTATEELLLALLGPRAAGGPRRFARQLLQSGRKNLNSLIAQVSADDRIDAESLAVQLQADGVGVLFCDDPRYPERLRRFPGAPPALFHLGRVELLDRPSVGVCGARNAGPEGLKAARACGEDAARLGVTVVSGYAKGVDTESHLAALEAGGGTVAVLAEGINHFKVKQAYGNLADTALEQLLVVSQFPPTQRWMAGAAMTRNSVIIGLGQALVVVEAGETGGTFKAGEVALQAGRPVFVLGLSTGMPPGNKKLLAEGGRPIMNRKELMAEFRQLKTGSDAQLPLEP
jgi:DNA processing protein